MAEATAEAPPAEAPAAAMRVRRPVRWWSLLAKIVLSLVAGAMLMLVAVGLLLDTDLGHRVLLDRIAAMTPNSGLRIRIGRIEGSIWGKTELRDVRLYDPQGLWAESPRMTLDWQPTSWLWDRLAISEIGSELAIVHRLPKFEPERERRSLPSYDVHVGRFDLAQLRFEPAVTGTRRTARVSGEAEYRSGRFLLDLDAAMRGGGDRLALLIDSAPDDDQFELELSLDAPADGVLVRMLGAAVPVRAEVRGDGSWSRWDGRARIALSGREAGDLRLAARAGRYGAAGWLEAAPLIPPRLAAFAAGRLDVRGEGRVDEGVLDGRFSAASPAARLAVQGAADLREDEWRDVRAGIVLLRPAPLVGGAAVSAGTRLTAVLDGPFAERSIAYRAAVPRLEVGGTAFEALQASGSGRWAGDRLTLPIAATARRVSGGAGVLLTDVRLGGTIRAEGNRVVGEGMTLASDRLRSAFRFDADLAGGRTVLAGNAASEGLALAGVGTVDVGGDWRAESSGGGAFSLAGTSRGAVRRFDNQALLWAAGGPLRFETGVAAGRDGAVQLSNLRLAAPRLQLVGTAVRRADGGLTVEGSGRQASLGPLSLQYGGERLSLRLARPSESLGLRDVRVEVEPAASGFGYRAAGRSPLGPFAARGTVAPGGAALQVAALSVSGAHASGVLRPSGGGVSGRLDLRGALSGPLTLSARGGGQHVEAALVASDARLGRVPIGSGRIEAAVSVAGGGGLAGRARFDGAADRLWAMTGVEGASLSGPLVADVQFAGTASNPALSGTVRLDGGRFASSAAGTRIDGIDARARFDGERLVIEALSGRTGDEGRIAGSGTIGFGGAVDVRVEMERALLFARPELRGRVTGPLRIRSDGAGGTISGTLRLTGGEVKLGRASDGEGGARGGGRGWALDLGLQAERIEVEGRGLDSRWSGALRIGGTTGAPAITGEATLIDGRYRVLGASFALERGTMTFDGSADPRLDIVARPGGAGGAAVRIGGRASRPELGLAGPSSERRPALPPAHRSQEALPARRARRRTGKR